MLSKTLEWFLIIGVVFLLVLFIWLGVCFMQWFETLEMYLSENHYCDNKH